MKWKQIRKFLPVIGIGLFIYLLIKLDIKKIFLEIENINLSYIAIALILIALFFVTQTLKWFIIARKQKIAIPFKDAFMINLISSFYGFITPSKIGSVMRVDYLREYNPNTGKGFSNFVIDKVLDLSSLFVFAITFAFIFYEEIISTTYLYVIIGFFALLIFLSFFFYKKERSKPLLRFVYRVLIPNRMKEKSKMLFGSFYEDIPSLPFLFFAFIVNLFNWIVDYSGMYFMCLALGINIGFIPLLAILPISTLVAQIPITINGYGIRELTMITLFGLFGVGAVKVFSMSILSIFLTNVIPSLFAILFIFLRKRK
jgi:hypothetical protein